MANTLLYGFIALADKDFLNQKALNVPEVKAAIELSVEAHNAAVNQYIDLLAVRTTNYTQRFESNATGVLQPLDEFGRSRKLKTSTYSLGFPIKMAGAATGFTFVSREKATVQQVNNRLAQILAADIRWIRRQMFGALFDNTATGRVFADPEWGDINIYGLANGDAAPKYYIGYSDSEAADNHYQGVAAAIADNANPFPAIYDELKEHGENEGDVISFIATSLKATVTALAEFVPVTPTAALNIGANRDSLSGFPQANLPPGAIPLGYLKNSKIWVAEWKMMPADYIISKTTGGDAPLAFREDPEPALQGFRSENMLEDFPYYAEQWFRRGGFAGHSRIGAVVTYIGNATYPIPAGYSLVMAV